MWIFCFHPFLCYVPNTAFPTLAHLCLSSFVLPHQPLPTHSLIFPKAGNNTAAKRGQILCLLYHGTGSVPGAEAGDEQPTLSDRWHFPRQGAGCTAPPVPLHWDQAQHRARASASPSTSTLTYPRTTQSVLVCSLLLPGFTFFSRLQPLCYFSAPLPALCTPAGLSRRAAVSQTAPPAPGAAPCPALYVQFLLNLNRVQDLGPDPKHSMV